jgi:hypothetical protein
VRRDSKLLKALLRGCCSGGADADRSGFAQIAAAAAPADWQHAFAVLASHRLLPLACQELGESRLAGAPAAVLLGLRAAARTTFVQNAVAMRGLEVVLAALKREGVEPIVLKGAALLNAFYPSLGSRPMIDVDLLLERGDEERAARVFAALGYRRTPEGDAWNYVDAEGRRFDVVHRFRVFEHVAFNQLAEPLEPRFLAGGPIRSLEPNAMLVHLVVHMNGHRRAVGHLLAWFVDVARVLHASGARIDAGRLAPLLLGGEGWTWLLRTVAFLHDEFGVPAPQSLQPQLHGFAPLTLEEVLRSRRVCAAAPSFARLVRHLVGRLFGGAGSDDAADAADFVGAVGDSMRERRARRVIERWRSSTAAGAAH